VCANGLRCFARTVIARLLPRKATVAVSSTQRTPENQPTAKPVSGQPAPQDKPIVTGSGGSRWPVLARISDVQRVDEKPLASDAMGSPATYRVDAPHSYAPQVAQSVPATAARHAPAPVDSARLQSTISAALRAAEMRASASSAEPSTADPAQAQARSLQGVPIPLRAAVETWQIVQPHGKLIRLAATLALMIAGGMSMALFMRQRTEPSDEGASAITASHEPTTTAPELQQAELHPTLEPVVAPDTDTTSLEPTATGPLAPASQPVMAIESTQPNEPEPSPAAVLPYPVTSFAEAPLPPLRGDALPQVRTGDPEVARLRGDVLPTQIR
jgi:hypothetical protein